MDNEVTFKSERFRPVLPEDCQVNPGRYGAELAFWLCAKLVEAGVVTSYPNYEDWGWFIEYITETGDEYWLCCGNVDGSIDEWLCFVDPKGKGLFGGKKASMENAEPLLRGLHKVLEAEDSIREIRWSSTNI